jgi:L-seryl-tRNA(Ser) seleniumtransferase
LTGADGVLVVNNNAAAVFLALNTLAQARQWSFPGPTGGDRRLFRMPRSWAAGAIPPEVGTTNKTYLKDYEQAITSETAVLLKVHPSNFRIMGFTKEVALPELVALGRRYGLRVMEDLGSGCFVDLSRFGLEKEPTVQEAAASGADVITFSGDKLLGGPQAGIILGNREVVGLLKQNPLLRALRPDKLTLAGLEATLRLYRDEPRALAELPTLAMLTRPLGEVGHRPRLLRLLKTFAGRLNVEVRESRVWRRPLHGAASRFGRGPRPGGHQLEPACASQSPLSAG